jgi:hypothetical protein
MEYLLDYENIEFDEYYVNSDGTYWTQICCICVEEHNIDEKLLKEDYEFHHMCGVDGCYNLSNYLLDFPPNVRLPSETHDKLVDESRKLHEECEREYQEEGQRQIEFAKQQEAEQQQTEQPQTEQPQSFKNKMLNWLDGLANDGQEKSRSR